MGRVCYAAKDFVSVVAAFGLMAIAGSFDRRKIHAVCLSLGAIGLLSIGSIHGEEQKSFLLGALALAWASILSMPYAMLAGALPAERMGVYMGIFSFFHHASRNPGCAHLWSGREESAPRESDLRRHGRRWLHAHGGDAHAFCASLFLRPASCRKSHATKACCRPPRRRRFRSPDVKAWRWVALSSAPSPSYL